MQRSLTPTILHSTCALGAQNKTLQFLFDRMISLLNRAQHAAPVALTPQHPDTGQCSS